MNLRSKLGLATIGLLCVQVAQAGAAHGATAPAALPASAVTTATLHAADTQSVIDAPGNVYDGMTGKVVPPPTQNPADVESATSSNLGGNVTMRLSVYGTNPNPLTDPGWLTNTPASSLTAVEWILVTPNKRVYLAALTTHATSATSGLSGQLFSGGTGGSVPLPVSCDVTPSYSPAAGYSVSFASICIGAPTSYQWNGLISYHPAGYPATDAIGKAAPEQGSFPKKLIFAPAVTSPAVPLHSTGYWLFATDGGVFTHGSANFYGSTGSMHLNKPIVGSAPTIDGKGYWLVASDGGIFSFGDAQFYGSTGAEALNKPIVGMTPTPDGSGYWLVASDGGIFTFGDAGFFGSTGGEHLNQPIVGMASTPDGKGYWLVASDGGIFAFGDAKFYGSTGGEHLNKPILGMASTADGKGYWLVASDGGIFAFGDAGFFGSTGGQHLNQPIVGIAATVDGGGYWLVASDGGIFTFGDATFYGSQGSEVLNKPIVTMAASTT